jgi:hypothetical protein
MNFTEAVTEVINTSKRPDKILEARRAVNAAVSFYSQDADFKRDIQEVALAIDPFQYSANLPFTELTRYRKFRSIKRGGTRCYLDELTGAKISACASLADVYYIAGSGIRYSLAALASTLDIAYFQYPPTLTDALDNNTYWMLDIAPHMIIDRALGQIFSSIGDDTSSKRHEAWANVAYLSWRTDQLATTDVR